MMPMSFRQHMATAWMPELRQRRSGCPSPASAEEGGLSLGHLSLATQRKVARPPQVDETLVLSLWLIKIGNRKAAMPANSDYRSLVRH
jgi:hypothetical protein